jgi:hypothetical protein
VKKGIVYHIVFALMVFISALWVASVAYSIYSGEFQACNRKFCIQHGKFIIS